MTGMDAERLYETCYMQVYSYAMTLCRSRSLAEEITEETFFKALTAKNSAAFTATTDTASGDFGCDFPTVSPSGKKNVYEANGGAELRFDTASGDVRIKMK